MKERLRIPIDEGVLSWIQSKCYIRDGLRVLNCQLIHSGAEGPLYERYIAEYLEACAEYQAAYDELVKCVAPEYTGPGFASELSFLTGELVIYEEDKM